MQRVRGTLIRVHGPWYVIATNSKQYWIWNIGEGRSCSIMGGRRWYMTELLCWSTSWHYFITFRILNYILHHLQFIEEYFFGICRFDRAELSSILVLDFTRHVSNIRQYLKFGCCTMLAFFGCLNNLDPLTFCQWKSVMYIEQHQANIVKHGLHVCSPLSNSALGSATTYNFKEKENPSGNEE